ERKVHLGRFLNAWGVASYRAGDYRDAEEPLQRALTIREAVLGAQHPDMAQSLNNLAALYDAQGRYGEAEALLKRALAIREGVLGAQHPDVAVILENYAVLLHAINRNEEAKKLETRAQTIRANDI